MADADEGTADQGTVPTGPVTKGTAAQEGTQPVRFGLDGIDYVADLPADDAARLRAVLAAYAAVARRVRTGRTRRNGPPTPPADETSRIRAWAGDHGFTVSRRGRIPKVVLEAYAARQRSAR